MRQELGGGNFGEMDDDCEELNDYGNNQMECMDMDDCMEMAMEAPMQMKSAMFGGISK